MRLSRTIVVTSLVVMAARPAIAQYQATFLDAGSGGELLAAGSGQQAGLTYVGGVAHAAVWSDSVATLIDLHPAAYANSTCYGVGGGAQVGYATVSSNPKAILWHGSAAGFVNLAPVGTTASYAFATDGVQQVGAARTTSTLFRALMWTGTAASAVNLHPTGSMVTSMAEGVDAGHQVGYVAGSGNIYACYWTGSAASTTLIHPVGAFYSRAHAVSGSQIVGEAGDFGGPGTHAALWTSFSAASAVSLKPLWLDGSDYAYDTNGTTQVGYGVDAPGVHHAIVWQGTAASALDLNQFLPAGATGAEAWGIDDRGYVVGLTYFGVFTRTTLWRPTVSIEGDVILKDFVGDMTAQPLTIEVRQPGTGALLQSLVIHSDAVGHFRFETALRGVYDIAMKGNHWLRKLDLGIDTTAVNPTANFALTNGDIDDNNEITIGDYSLLSVAYGSMLGDPNWDSASDLNGDEAVDIGDYAILSANYGLFGDD